MNHHIGAGSHRVGKGDETFSVIGLGSCVAIVLYDKASRIGGLAHVLLPDPSLSTTPEKTMKFATTAIPQLLSEMEELGAGRGRCLRGTAI